MKKKKNIFDIINGENIGKQCYALSAIVPKGLEAKENFLFEAKTLLKVGPSGICWPWLPCRLGPLWQRADFSATCISSMRAALTVS